MESKYFKPRSVTWWSAVVPLVCGLFMAAEPLHHMADWVEALHNATGQPAPVLIQLGLFGIGIRGAVK